MRPLDPKIRRRILRAVLSLALLLAVAMLGWGRWVYGQIERYAHQDDADRISSADAIVVFGAAEYNGRPSPVFRARLDHALLLYHRNIAPLIITMGGNGGDQYNEGTVGREYLMTMGVPESALIAETQSHDTRESVRRMIVIARANRLHRLVIVSDGAHLFRIHEIFAAEGLPVFTSPRPRVSVEGGVQGNDPVIHEIFSYMAWRLGLH